MRLSDAAYDDENCPKRGLGLTHTDDGEHRCRDCGITIIPRPYEVDPPKAGVCRACGKEVRAVWTVHAGTFCARHLAEVIRRAVASAPATYTRYRIEDEKHATVRRNPK